MPEYNLIIKILSYSQKIKLLLEMQSFLVKKLITAVFYILSFKADIYIEIRKTSVKRNNNNTGTSYNKYKRQLFYNILTSHSSNSKALPKKDRKSKSSHARIHFSYKNAQLSCNRCDICQRVMKVEDKSIFILNMLF